MRSSRVVFNKQADALVVRFAELKQGWSWSLQWVSRKIEKIVSAHKEGFTIETHRATKTHYSFLGVGTISVQQRHMTCHGGFSCNKYTLLTTVGLRAIKTHYSSRWVSVQQRHITYCSPRKVSVQQRHISYCSPRWVSVQQEHIPWRVLCLYCAVRSNCTK